jgi:anaerobic selenocysteine-containing dehydrogenase
MPGARSLQRPGDRTVGIDEKPSVELLDQIKKVSGFNPPREHGHAATDAVQAMLDGRSKVFVGMGGNFVAAVPDRPLIEAAMRKLRLAVAVNTKLNRSYVVHGQQSLILPCLARSDIDIQRTGRQSVTVEDSMSMVRASTGLVAPPSGELKSEVAIVCGMGRAALPDSGIDWTAFEDNYRLIRDKIEEVFPSLFHNFNQRILQPGWFHLTQAGLHCEASYDHAAGRRACTARRRAQYCPTTNRVLFGGETQIAAEIARMVNDDRRGLGAGGFPWTVKNQRGASCSRRRFLASESVF